jgi:iron(III) transport system substrate-binding protein
VRLIRPALITAVFAVATSLSGLSPAWAASRSVADIANLSGPDRQKILEEGAKQEKEVMFYTSLIVDQVVRPLADGFEKKYPFLKVVYLRNNSTQLLQRILAEGKARSVQADVVAASVGASLKKTGFIQAFNSPELAAYPKEYLDPDNLLAPTRFAYQGIGFNTRLVKEDEAPQTYEDLLDPKWRGKMVWSTSTDTGAPFLISHIRKFMGDDKAREYLKKLATQRIATSGSSIRAILDQVIAGEYTVGISMALHHIAISKEKGAPVGGTILAPVPARGGEIVLLKGAPHPHAAMLFLDYVLSKEGQAIFAEAQYYPARPDVPAITSMQPYTPRLLGKSESIIADEELDALRPKSVEIFKEFFR